MNWEAIGYAITDPRWGKEHLETLEGGRGLWAPDISYHNGRFYICATLRLNDDGRRYMLINRGARIMETSEDGTQCLSEPRMIWYGFSGHAPEGPHLLKKDGYYYCFLAEGGTGKGHMATVARSKNLYGPYESCPYNPILRQPELDELIWTPDGWPVIKGGGKPSTMAPLPFYHRGAIKTGNEPVRRKQLFDWMAPRTIDRRRIRVEAGGFIRITGDGRDLCERKCKSLLVRWQPEFNFAAEFEMFLPPPDKQGVVLADSEAGMTLYYDENTFIKFGLTNHQVFVKEYIDDSYTRVYNTAFMAGGADAVRLKIITMGLRRCFYLNDKPVCSLDNVTCLCPEGLVKGKRFTGATYGVYIYGKDTICWRQHRGI